MLLNQQMHSDLVKELQSIEKKIDDPSTNRGLVLLELQRLQKLLDEQSLVKQAIECIDGGAKRSGAEHQKVMTPSQSEGLDGCEQSQGLPENLTLF